MTYSCLFHQVEAFLPDNCATSAPQIVLKPAREYTTLRALATPLYGFVESPGLTLRVDHSRCSPGGETCQSFSLLRVPTE